MENKDDDDDTYFLCPLNIGLVEIRNTVDMRAFYSSACHNSGMPGVCFRFIP